MKRRLLVLVFAVLVGTASTALLVWGLDLLENIHKQRKAGSSHQGLIDLVKGIIGKFFCWASDHQAIETDGNRLIF